MDFGLVDEQAAEFKVGNFSRDLTAATATVVYTGVGFQPRAIQFNGTVTLSFKSVYMGMSDGTTQRTLLNDGFSGTDYVTQGGGLIMQFRQALGAPDDTHNAVLDSFDADGFTLTWTKLGVPTGTAVCGYMAFR